MKLSDEQRKDIAKFMNEPHMKFGVREDLYDQVGEAKRLINLFLANEKALYLENDRLKKLLKSEELSVSQHIRAYSSLEDEAHRLERNNETMWDALLKIRNTTGAESILIIAQDAMEHGKSHP